MQISYSPPLTTVSTPGRRFFPVASRRAAPAVDLTNATTVADIMNIALQLPFTSTNATIRSALIQGLTSDDVIAVSTAVASLNSQTASATDPATTQLSQYYVQSRVSFLSIHSLNYCYNCGFLSSETSILVTFILFSNWLWLDFQSFSHGL